MQRFLRYTPEQAFAVYDSTSPPFACYDPQDGPGTFQPIQTRPKWNLMDPFSNVPRQCGSEVYAYGGRWTGRFYWDQIDLALWPQRVDSGQTTPWPTDCRPGDLASLTLDFGYSYHDLSRKRIRYLGVKPGASWEYSCRADPANPFLTFAFDLIASKSQPNTITTSGGTDAAPDAAAFPEPTEADYPDLPLNFWHAVFTSQGAVVDYFDAFTIRGQQRVKPYYDSKRFANRISHNGRTVTLTAHLRLDAANDPRTRYEALTALGATTIVFTKPGAADTLTFDFRSKTYLDSVAEETPLDDDAYTQISATAYLDSAAGDDFSITISS